MQLLVLAIASAVCAVANGAYSFISVGDWGGANVGKEANVQAVAAEMNAISIQYNSQFILNTGDNFYWCGIQNTSDTQIQIDYVTPFLSYSSLQQVWYSTLGNHEYGYNVDAQVQYSALNPSWYMPSRYYTKRIQMSATNYMTLIVLDTSPCVTGYRSSNPNNWDPCYPTYPTCSPTSTDDDFEGPCMFNSNILSQSCDAQFNWYQNVLLGVPKDDWLVVMGHHPIDEVTEKDFISPMQQHGFSIYLNGHTHLLNQYTIDHAGVYFTTGAGSMVNTADQSLVATVAKLKGQNVSAEAMKDMTGTTTGHSYQTVVTKTVAGFLLHTFNNDFTELTTSMIEYTGQSLYTFVSDRFGKGVNAAVAEK